METETTTYTKYVLEVYMDSKWRTTNLSNTKRSRIEPYSKDPGIWPCHPKRVVEIVTTTTVSKRIVSNE